MSAAGGGSGIRGLEQVRGARGDLLDGRLESLLVPAGRLAVAAHLAHELEGGGADLLFAGGLFLPPQGLGASAHVENVPRSGAHRGADSREGRPARWSWPAAGP